jgi:hypothetical protein
MRRESSMRAVVLYAATDCFWQDGHEIDSHADLAVVDQGCELDATSERCKLQSLAARGR